MGVLLGLLLGTTGQNNVIISSSFQLNQPLRVSFVFEFDSTPSALQPNDLVLANCTYRSQIPIGSTVLVTVNVLRDGIRPVVVYVLLPAGVVTPSNEAASGSFVAIPRTRSLIVVANAASLTPFESYLRNTLMARDFQEREQTDDASFEEADEYHLVVVSPSATPPPQLRNTSAAVVVFSPSASVTVGLTTVTPSTVSATNVTLVLSHPATGAVQAGSIRSGAVQTRRVSASPHRAFVQIGE